MIKKLREWRKDRHLELQDHKVYIENIYEELMGYDANKVMNETIKEISSRNQDKVQQEIWLQWGFDGTKWQKDLSQDVNTLYKANYQGCKI